MAFMYRIDPPPLLIAIALVVLAVGGCDSRPPPEQAKRTQANQEALANFEREQADATLSNWTESRLLDALSSNDLSDRSNAAYELGNRKSVAARAKLLDLMLSERHDIAVHRYQWALIRIGNPDDIAAIREYAEPRAATLDGEFLRNLAALDDPWVEALLQDAWNKATDNGRRRQVVSAQTMRRDRMTR